MAPLESTRIALRIAEARLDLVAAERALTHRAQEWHRLTGYADWGMPPKLRVRACAPDRFDVWTAPARRRVDLARAALLVRGVVP